MVHLEDMDIIDFVVGDVDAPTRSASKAHLGECSDCRERMHVAKAELKRVRQRMKQVSPENHGAAYRRLVALQSRTETAPATKPHGFREWLGARHRDGGRRASAWRFAPMPLAAALLLVVIMLVNRQPTWQEYGVNSEQRLWTGGTMRGSVHGGTGQKVWNGGGRLKLRQVDPYPIRLSAGARVTVSVHDLDGSPDTDLDLRVLDKSGSVIASDTARRSECWVKFTTPHTGTYSLRVYNKGGKDNNSYALECRIDEKNR
jgi:hypothetical protein